MGGQVGQLAMEVRVGRGQLCDGGLAGGFGGGEFVGGGGKGLVVVVDFGDCRKVGVVASLLRRAMHGVLDVVRLGESPL